MSALTRTKDELLAVRCQLGDAAAFRELVEEMESPLMYFAGKLLGSERDAPDVVQEVWLQAFARLRQLREPAALRAWLYQITRAAAAGRTRRDVARELRETRAVLEEPPPRDEPEDQLWLEQDAAVLHRALDTLSLQHREVLTLHFLEELSLEEIAEIVHAPVGTVKSRLFHAKRRVREAWGQQRP